MVLGSIGYVCTAAVYYFEWLAIFVPLIFLFAWGLTFGLLIAFFQLFYGLAHYFYRSKGDRHYLVHCKAFGIWCFGLVIYSISAANGLIVTV
ncbi:Uncharacterised protein [BD1-7 clade bacterium]|uniref:Uncharacterized protein n=1 Tax=BD1-7 clade bacterium TaxID=2029982 RepID=A0A5S9Q7W3_9GAMM|nr:Uncharacterised protein [BD1-7 clade bacterium]